MTTSAEATSGTPPRVGVLRLVLIYLAVMIALPAFVMGAELSHALGASDMVWATLGGGLILAACAAVCGAVGARTRHTTYELIVDAFGTHGARLANVVLGLCMLGWYGVIAMMFGHALSMVSPALAHAPMWLLVSAGCVLTTLTAVAGFRALDALSMVTTPLKLVLLVWTFAAALSGGMGPVWAFAPMTPLALGSGVSMVAGGLIVGVVVTPDMCRFASSPWRAALACALAFGLGFPAVLLLSGLPSLVSGERDLVKIMLTLGMGLPALLIVALTAWSTNAYNLYAAKLIAQTLRPRQPSWQLGLLAGVLGAALGLAGISDLLFPYLLLLGMFIPPIGGIYVLNHLLGNRAGGTPVHWRADSLLAWAAGSGWAALAPRWGLALTPVPALDAIAVAAVAYVLLRRSGWQWLGGAAIRSAPRL
jgi:cytosine permease